MNIEKRTSLRLKISNLQNKTFFGRGHSLHLTMNAFFVVQVIDQKRPKRRISNDVGSSAWHTQFDSKIHLWLKTQSTVIRSNVSKV
jgi:hypothetical protein